MCDKVVQFENDCYTPAFEETADLSCVGYKGLYDYLGAKEYGYGWHITDLVIYDKPKELSEFKQIKIIRGYHKEGETKIEKLLKGSRIEVKYLTRPPQSWCYCEELKGES